MSAQPSDAVALPDASVARAALQARHRAQRREVLELLGAFVGIGVIMGLGAAFIIGLAHDVILRETERQLRATALLAAGRIDGDALATVHGPEDLGTPEYRRVQAQLMQIRTANPEFRWVYTLRYSGSGDGWYYLVDAQPWALDLDGDNVLSGTERATLPGDVWNAGYWHSTLLEAQSRSAVDMTPVDEPPWGITVSGWAPIYTRDGRLAGLVAVDMMYGQVINKLDAVTVGVIGSSALVGFLLLYAFYLLRRRTSALRRVVELQRELYALGGIYAKFVPERVRRELAEHPDGSSLERQERDVTVMFLDVAGYTRLSERLAGEAIGELLERYFSRYLDVIHRYGGQINETAGDGLMILFEAEPPYGHARAAVQAAIEIQAVTEALNQTLSEDEEPTRVNIGINSGLAHVGLNKFRSLVGERFTYTATGPTTNIAARVAGVAKKGDILLGEATAERVRGVLELEKVGQRSLKNVSRPVMLYRPVGTLRGGVIDPRVSGELDATGD